MVARRVKSPVKPAVAGLTLYVGTNDCWSLWTRLVFVEKDIDHSRILAIRPGVKNEDLLVLNPEMRMPAMVERDLVLTGARTIVEYLHERFPQPRLLPTDPAGRAKVRMALDRFESELFPALEMATHEKASANAKAALTQLVAMSGRWFSSRSLFLGTEYGLADCAWAVWLLTAQKHGQTLPPNAAEYLQRLLKRPAVATLAKPLIDLS